jgi:hypothetical protein
VWWAGQSLLDVAPYIADARALQLVLLGGFTGAEVEGRYDRTLGYAVHTLGSAAMIASLGAAAWLTQQRAAELRSDTRTGGAR